MMNGSMKSIGGPVLLLILVLFQVSPALARSDVLIQREIEAQIAGATKLRDARIEVHVKQRLAVLTGQVRLYEQKLISERIAWTTLGVFEVDNEIRVVPKVPLADAAIERRIKEIVSTYERFHGAGLVVKVENGVVSIDGSFIGMDTPVFLKHMAGEIEGVVDIKIHATFLTWSN